MASTTAESRPIKQAATTLRFVAAAVVCTALFAAVLMCLNGSPLRRPMSLPMAALLGVACGAASLVFRGLAQQLRKGEDPAAEAALALPALVLFLLAFALPSAGSSVTSHLVLYLGFVVSELLWWFAVRDRSPGRFASVAVRSADQSDATHHSATHHLGNGSTEQEAGPTRLAGDEKLRMTRAEGANGESVVVEFRERFESTQRHATLHAAFSPPLIDTPEVHVEHAGGPPATVKITQAESFGVRLDVRLEKPHDKPVDVYIHCTALATKGASE